MTQAEQKDSTLTWPLLPKMSWRHILRPVAAAVGKPQVQSVADNGNKVAPEPIAVVDKLDEALRSGDNWQYFQVPADYRGDQELVITVGTAANANIAIAIGANARVHIREQRWAQATRGQLHNEVRLQIGAGAQVRYSTTDNFSGSDVLIYRRAELAANATLDWYAGIFGAVTGAFEHRVELLGTGSQAHVNTAVLAGGSGQLVCTSRVTNRGRHTQGTIKQHGVVTGSAHLIMNGIGSIVRGARGSDAQQENRVLMLTPDARAEANPLLLIDENDVTAGHAASVAAVDQDQLYYLSTRGISKDVALRLLVRGFLLGILPGDLPAATQQALAASIDQVLQGSISSEGAAKHE
ncbi:SufB/SufD family protein [Lacticaseibacillus zhaodongensis]|uniref:SufB/SufD family protein n=1 Tax=Lacticaseibacillus zhaodongensis TaxID=2668065 RepID=UPI0012D36A53|nr:SufD family Fe-S cluster assembly protein [Lacticaseibacillus zhaodongensis]